MRGSRAERLWVPQYRALITGLVLTITFVASEALAVVTVMPVAARDLGGLKLYGWVFSAFMLGSVAGISVAGREADRRGPAVPFVAGLVLFGAGLLVAGLAPDMAVMVAGRVLQGAGAGAVPAVAYAAIGRSLPGPLRARMMAVLSTAWVAPGLAGPVLAAEVARLFGWRWVFLGLLPVVAVSGAVAMPALIRIGRSADADAGQDGRDAQRLIDGLRTAAGAALLLAGLTVAAAGSWHLAAGGALVVAGAVAGLPALRRLVPAGTLTSRPGLPSVIAVRGLLTFAFFGGDAYVTLAITELRHYAPLVGSLAVTGATLTWTAGSWVQARVSQTWSGRSLIAAGLVFVLIGTGGMVAVLFPAVPIGVGVAAWTVAGLGMGLGYAPLSLLMLREAPPGREGWASGALTLSDTLGTALGIGVGGTAVAAAASLRSGVLIAFVLAAVVGVACLAVTVRLPPGPAADAPQPGGAAAVPQPGQAVA
jgi:MFS family permease